MVTIGEARKYTHWWCAHGHNYSSDNVDANYFIIGSEGKVSSVYEKECNCEWTTADCRAVENIKITPKLWSAIKLVFGETPPLPEEFGKFLKEWLKKEKKK